MPPFGFRKRQRSSSPAPAPPKKAATPKRSKPTLFETVDSPGIKQSSLEDNKRFLQRLEDGEDSSLSEVDSEEFEDVPPAKRRKLAISTNEGQPEREEEDDNDDEDEMEWEDAIQQDAASQATPSAAQAEPEITDVSISMNDDGTYIEPLVSAATGKKGPSKRERLVRVQAHCLHVQALMRHNSVRNSWLNDKEVQKVLVDQLPDGVSREVQMWKEAMQRLKGEKPVEEQQSEKKGKAKRGKKGKQKSAGRDWNAAAEYIEDGERAGDPLLRLLRVLTAYWRKRFIVTAPSLRKQGYKPLRKLRDEIRAWEKDRKNFEAFGERIETAKDFCRLAKVCEGSRDVGAQLFVALLRGIGLETRMVANLQPIGFGWSKAEEAYPERAKRKDEVVERVESDFEADAETSASASKSTKASKKSKKPPAVEKPSRKSTKGDKSDPIDLEDSDSALSSAPSETEEDALEDGADDLSVVEITPSSRKKKPMKKYDRDMAFPNYWTEVCSPVSHKYYPVDPIVLATIASNDELLQTFEPRGKKAENAKQVICYTIAFASDGTAKDVTVRYLKWHQLPGKTKGTRMPIEKIPILNRRGKVKRYEDYDWFSTLMLIYNRAENERTAADNLEDQTDLQPRQLSKEKKEVAKESLQGYKQSADYVLEQHLRREEAILPGAGPVKYFVSGKGDKAQELPVYSREDVVSCKTVESWHKEGRAIKTGEQPLKYVPVRAVTLIRKREMEDVQRETGEKMKQGLYSEAQTDWIIPPPIQNGVIPKNAFGNMDVYVETMVPKGAKHLPLKGSAKICKKLGIDYAEACTGFEFGKQRAVPVLTGVVVAQENAAMVRDAWRTEQEENKRKEDTKRTAAALHWWRKMLLGLRVLERMRVEYADSGQTEADFNPFPKKQTTSGRPGDDEATNSVTGEHMGGRFFPPGHDEEEVLPRNVTLHSLSDDQGNGFLFQEEMDVDIEGGGFLVEEDVGEEVQSLTKNDATTTPVSLQSKHKVLGDALDSDVEVTVAKPLPRGGKLTSFPNKPAKTASSLNGSNPTKASRGRKTHISNGDDDESALSDESDSVSGEFSDGSESVGSDAVLPPPPTKKTKAKSPQVVIKNGSGLRTRSAIKSTPVKSQYFHKSDASEDSNEDQESEVEVVKPRKTTTRTRAKA